MEFIGYAILFLGFVNFFRLSALTLFTFFYKLTLRTDVIKNDDSITGEYMPLVSVVIAAYNEEKVIQSTLKHLFESTYKNFEVIVINDGSKDKTEPKIQEFIARNLDKDITHVYQKNQGKAHALNNALNNYVKGELFMSLDADSTLRKDTLAKSIKYFRNKQVKALATNVKIKASLSPLGIIQRVEYLMGYHLKKALTVGNIEYIIGGVGSIFRTELVKQLGGYDTDTVTEDIDLTMKIVRLGNKENLMVYAEDVVVYTQDTLSLNALFRQRFRWKFGRFQTFWKNKDLFFNTGNEYTKMLTCVYLPYQLLSEFVFLFDPLFVLYILILTITYSNPGSYYGMLLFMMFFVGLAIATDYEATIKESIILLLISPLSYLIFFVVSIVEYCGLISCIIKWREIIYAKEYNRCGWTPVERRGEAEISFAKTALIS